MLRLRPGVGIHVQTVAAEQHLRLRGGILQIGDELSVAERIIMQEGIHAGHLRQRRKAAVAIDDGIAVFEGDDDVQQVIVGVADGGDGVLEFLQAQIVVGLQRGHGGEQLNLAGKQRALQHAVDGGQLTV